MVNYHDSLKFRSDFIERICSEIELMRCVREVDAIDWNWSDKLKPGVCLVHCLVECNSVRRST